MRTFWNEDYCGREMFALRLALWAVSIIIFTVTYSHGESPSDTSKYVYRNSFVSNAEKHYLAIYNIIMKGHYSMHR